MAGLGEIKGKSFLITGGASGLGALYAEAFLREGAKVGALGELLWAPLWPRRDRPRHPNLRTALTITPHINRHVTIVDIAEAKGKETAEQLNKTYPGSIKFIQCDVGDEESISKCFNQVVDSVKQLEVMINNAGILNDSPDGWRKSCDVNWQGLVSFTMKAVKHMRKDEGGAGGAIINIASVAALFPVGSTPIYCGSKAAVLHFSQSLSQAPFEETTGIRVLTICFGATDTALMQNLTERVYNEKYGEDFVNTINGLSVQKAESAVTAFVAMFKNGTNGSVWLSEKNQPVQDITPRMHAFHNSFIN